ncbi:MAG: polysaccharide biosynthesis tyrosine autokinase [Candidatus Limnocylindria bacterium]
MDLRRQLAVLRTWGRWIALGAALAGIAAFLLSQVLPKVYEADTRLLVGQALQSSSPDVDQFQSAMNLSQTYGEIAISRSLLTVVRDQAGIDETIEEFKKRITVVTGDQQPFIDIYANGDSPEQAAALASSVAAELLRLASTVGNQDDPVFDFVEQDLAAIQDQIVAIRAEIADLVAIRNRTTAQEARLQLIEGRLVDLRGTYAALLALTDASNANRLTVIDPAVAPEGPASPRPLLNTAIAVILGLLVMVGVAFVWDTLDDRLRTTDDVEHATGLSTLGTIMHMPGDRNRKSFYRLATLLYPRSPAAEAFRSLRTNLDFSSLDQQLRTLLVTSSGPSEGKTVVASNIAVAYAQSGRRVILIDADLRRPAIHEMFGLRNERGLTDLARDESLDVADVLHATEDPNLSIITAGTIPANPAELIGSHRMQETLERIRAATELVIIDTAPVGAVTDAAVLATDADATVLVIRGQRTSERLARRGREALAKVNAHVVGAVLNDVTLRASDALPYYGLYVDDAPALGSAADPNGRPADEPAGAAAADFAPRPGVRADRSDDGRADSNRRARSTEPTHGGDR